MPPKSRAKKSGASSRKKKATEAAHQSISLVTLDNPLLDISTHVDAELLKKYNLQPDNAILCAPEHLPLYDEIINNKDVMLIAGGAGQNSTRIAQWMLQGTGLNTAFLGCVGKDKYADLLRDAVSKDGVTPMYQTTDKVQTGTCAALINETEKGTGRSLVANISACNNFTVDHLKSAEVADVLKHAKVFYMTGFFLSVDVESMLYFIKEAKANGGVFAFNLAAPWVMQGFKDRVLQVLPYADIVFGNEHEAAILGDVMGWTVADQDGKKEADLKDIAIRMFNYEKIDKDTPRMVVWTHGSEPTLACADGKTVQEYPIIKLTKEQIVDVNGAGDSFVGGFLAMLVKGETDIAKCVAAAHYAAAEKLKHNGCTVPSYPPALPTT